MLVLTRDLNEQILIGSDIVITVVDFRGGKVRLGIDAPQDVSIHRMEVIEAIRRDGTQERFISERKKA